MSTVTMTLTTIDTFAFAKKIIINIQWLGQYQQTHLQWSTSNLKIWGQSPVPLLQPKVWLRKHNTRPCLLKWLYRIISNFMVFSSCVEGGLAYLSSKHNLVSFTTLSFVLMEQAYWKRGTASSLHCLSWLVDSNKPNKQNEQHDYRALLYFLRGQWAPRWTYR